MGQILLVTLREGIEMFLIVAIAATYLTKTGRRALVPAVGWGTGTALLASVILGVWLAEVAVTPAWESALALIAAVLVISMVVYMLSAAKHLRRHIGDKLDVAAARPGRGAWIGVFLFVVLMITREGMETAFLAASLFRQNESQHFVLGVLGGLLAAAAIGDRLGLAALRQAGKPPALLQRHLDFPRAVRRAAARLCLPRGDRRQPAAARQRLLAHRHRAVRARR
jgi:high-affinity iron transporter